MNNIPSSSSIHSFPTGLVGMNGNIIVDSISSATNALQSNNINHVVKGLNYLLLKSYDAHNDLSSNAVVQVEDHPRLLHALSDLLDVVNPAVRLLFDEIPSESYHCMMQDEFDGRLWNVSLLGSDKLEFKVCIFHVV